MPFLMFLLTTNLYYTQCMFSSDAHQGIWLWFCDEDDFNCEVQHDAVYYLRAVFAALLGWMAMIEFYQMSTEKCIDHWKQTTNRLDSFVIVINLICLFLHATDAMSLTMLRQMASIGLLGVWMQMFLWFRLFDSMA